MAGVDYHDVCSRDSERWEHEGLELPPPHLLAEGVEEESLGNGNNYSFPATYFCPLHALIGNLRRVKPVDMEMLGSSPRNATVKQDWKAGKEWQRRRCQIPKGNNRG
ncbi:conserved hypothetical protein [Ricinus communis]|uniref:Uncharacterized protein n=1 Tax=Ricinus communis TaxID=3988 RepID=B9T3M3_RICCO|nr:conserved hypothetical protein [Ricinus communis]